MPSRDEVQVADTPFAHVLTAYMWSKTPPWSATKLAAVLGINRTRVAKWCFHGITPSLDTMMHVMAKLDIPLATLVDAYHAARLPAPALTSDSPANATIAAMAKRTAANASRHADTHAGAGGLERGGESGAEIGAESMLIPYEDDDDIQGDLRQEIQIPRNRRQSSAGASGARGSATPAAPLTGQTASQATSEAEWETMIAHTRKVMKAAGMPELAIEEMLKSLRANKSARRTSSAHTNKPDSSADASTPPGHQSQRSTQRR